MSWAVLSVIARMPVNLVRHALIPGQTNKVSQPLPTHHFFALVAFPLPCYACILGLTWFAYWTGQMRPNSPASFLPVLDPDRHLHVILDRLYVSLGAPVSDQMSARPIPSG